MVGLSSDDQEVHDQSAALFKKTRCDMPRRRLTDEDARGARKKRRLQRKTREQESLEEIQQLKTDRYKNMKAELEAKKNAWRPTSPSELDDARDDKKTDLVFATPCLTG